jgi:hypothetical protein
MNKLPVSVESAGTTKEAWGDGCWMSMHETEKHTIEMHGDVKIKAPNCHFYGNSNHYNDVVDLHSCTNVLDARMVQTVGGGHHAGIDQDHCSHSTGVNIPSGVFLNGYIIKDPIGTAFAGNAKSMSKDCSNSSSGAEYNNFVVNKNNQILNPNTYCGGMDINADTKFEPGIYYIMGHFDINNAKVTGDDVTFVFSDDALITINNYKVIIKAPDSGVLSGMAFIGLNSSDDNRFVNSLIDIQGVVYMPFAKLDWTNSAKNQYTNVSQVKHNWTAWVVEGAKWRGNGTIYFNFPSGEIDLSDVKYKGYPKSLVNILPESNKLSAHLIL